MVVTREEPPYVMIRWPCTDFNIIIIIVVFIITIEKGRQMLWWVNHTDINIMLIIVRNDDQQMLLSCDNCTGNSRFSGFAIDLLTAISKVGQVFFIVILLLFYCRKCPLLFSFRLQILLLPCIVCLTISMASLTIKQR